MKHVFLFFFVILSNFTFSLSGGTVRRKLKDYNIRELLRYKGKVLRCKDVPRESLKLRIIESQTESIEFKTWKYSRDK